MNLCISNATFKNVEILWVSNIKKYIYIINKEFSIVKYYFEMQKKSLKNKKCMSLVNVFEKVTYIRKNVYVFSKEFSYLMRIIKIVYIQ